MTEMTLKNNQHDEAEHLPYDDKYEMSDERENYITRDEVIDPQQKQTILQTLSDFANISRMLRFTGALAVLGGMSVFLLKGDVSDDVTRYYELLAQTLILAFGGLLMSFVLKENKGARVFLGLALISNVVNMTTLGALIYSTVQWDNALAQYPSYAKWLAGDIGMSSFMLMVGAGFAVMLPIALFGYKVMARSLTRPLIATFLFTNLLLLLPVRESFYVGMVAIVGAAVPLYVIHKYFRSDLKMRTPEGVFAVATLFLPVAIIVSRNLWLYAMDDMLHIILSGVAIAILRVISGALTNNSTSKRIVNWMNVVAGISLSFAMAKTVQAHVSFDFYFTVFGAILATVVMDVSLRAGDRKDFAIRYAALLMVGCQLLQMIAVGDLINSIVTVIVGAGVVYIAKTQKNKMLFIVGIITVVGGFIKQLEQLVQFVDMSNWLHLAVLGISAIVIASVIERHGAVIKLKWSGWGKSLAMDDSD